MGPDPLVVWRGFGGFLEGLSPFSGGHLAVSSSYTKHLGRKMAKYEQFRGFFSLLREI